MSSWIFPIGSGLQTRRKRIMKGVGKSTRRARTTFLIIATRFQMLKSWKQPPLYLFPYPGYIHILSFVRIYPCKGLCAEMNIYSRVSQPLHFIQD